LSGPWDAPTTAIERGFGTSDGEAGDGMESFRPKTVEGAEKSDLPKKRPCQRRARCVLSIVVILETL
jgi:hypothetical protein